MKNILFFIIFILVGTSVVFGSYTITKFPSLSLCTTYPSAYTTGSFFLNETSISGTTGFTKNQTSRTLIIDFSNAAFQFKTIAGGASTTVTSTGPNVTINSFTITATSITVSITTAATNTGLDVIRFNNVEIRATAAGTGFIKRNGGTFKVDNGTANPVTTISFGDLNAGTPAVYSTSSATQAITSLVFTNSSDNQIIGVQVVVTGNCNVLTASSFSFNTAGSTAPATDIQNAKLYYTGITNIFSTSTLFGSVSSPNGAFTINGSQVLNFGAGTYYFWLTYDILSTGTNLNVLDAQHVSTVISGTSYANSSGNPAGSRTISNNNFFSLAAGKWDNTAIWSRSFGGPPCSCAPTGGTDFVHVNHAVDLFDFSRTVDFVTVENGGTLTNAASKILTVSNTLATLGNGAFTASTPWVLKDVSTVGTGSSSSSSALNLTGNLNVGVGTTFQLNGGVLLTVNGNITTSGILALGTSNVINSNAAGTLISGTGIITGSGIITLGVNKLFPFGTNLTIAPVIAIDNGVSVSNSGTINMQNNITGGSGASQWKNNANSILDMGGTTSALLVTGTLIASAIPNTVSYSGTGAQNIKTPTTSYYNLFCSSTGGGVKSLTGAITVNGNIQISGDAQLAVAAGANTITLNGNWINNSTNSAPLSPSTSAVFFNGVNIISGTGSTSFNNLNITATGNLTSNSSPGKVVVIGNWINDGSFMHASSDVTFNGTTILSGDSITIFNTMIVNATKALTLHATETNVDGDITSNGTLNHNNGHVIFSGGGNTQNLNGSTSTLTLFTSEIDNLTGNLLLARPLTINSALTLTNGNITTTSTNILTLIAGATSNSGSATSFVNGPMDKVLTTASFVFPVGNNSRWARIGVGIPSVNPTTFRAQYFANPYSNTSTMAVTPLPLLNNVSTKEYWQLDRTAGTGNATVTLYWENASFSGINDCSTGDLRVARWSGTAWQNNNDAVITTGSCSGVTSGTISTSANVILFSPFTFGSKGSGINPLPIELISFSSKCENNNVVLLWSTAFEANNDYFTLERSTDGINFSMISKLNGAGNSTTIINYSFIDSSPIFFGLGEGEIYYRLKQTDYDGNYKYSSIIVSKNCGDDLSDLLIYPNPNNGTFEIKNIMKQSQIEIVNLLGEKIFSSLIGEDLENVFNLSNQPNGIYLVRIKSENGIATKKFIINK